GRRSSHRPASTVPGRSTRPHPDKPPGAPTRTAVMPTGTQPAPQLPDALALPRSPPGASAAASPPGTVPPGGSGAPPAHGRHSSGRRHGGNGRGPGGPATSNAAGEP